MDSWRQKKLTAERKAESRRLTQKIFFRKTENKLFENRPKFERLDSLGFKIQDSTTEFLRWYYPYPIPNTHFVEIFQTSEDDLNSQQVSITFEILN